MMEADEPLNVTIVRKKFIYVSNLRHHMETMQMSVLKKKMMTMEADYPLNVIAVRKSSPTQAT